MFDLEKLQKNKRKSLKHIENSSFYQFVHNDLIDRLAPIDNNFKNILVINSSDICFITPMLKTKYPSAEISTQTISEPIIKNKFDLIIIPMSLHWISDIQLFLKNIRESLKANGILMCNFPGEGSLRKLRIKIMEAESLTLQNHSPHISPFIQFEQITPLMQQAGFIENIIDIEKLDLENKSPLKLMQSIKNIGESNALILSHHYSINKKMYKLLQQESSKPFIDHINFITLLASPTKNSIKLKNEYFEK